MNSSKSEKADKVAAHKRERRKVHTKLKSDGDSDALPQRREISNVWAYAKDGKIYKKSWMRPKELRK